MMYRKLKLNWKRRRGLNANERERIINKNKYVKGNWIIREIVHVV